MKCTYSTRQLKENKLRTAGQFFSKNFVLQLFILYFTVFILLNPLFLNIALAPNTNTQHAVDYVYYQEIVLTEVCVEYYQNIYFVY